MLRVCSLKKYLLLLRDQRSISHCAKKWWPQLSSSEQTGCGEWRQNLKVFFSLVNKFSRMGRWGEKMSISSNVKCIQMRSNESFSTARGQTLIEMSILEHLSILWAWVFRYAAVHVLPTERTVYNVCRQSTLMRHMVSKGFTNLWCFSQCSFRTANFNVSGKRTQLLLYP